MRPFDSLEISASGLTAQQEQMNLIAANIANVNTTQTMAGGPYRRQVAVFQEKTPFEAYFVPAAFGLEEDGFNTPIGSGVRVSGIERDPSPPKRVYDPNNPAADEHGYVTMPNVDLITEMTNMIQTSRAYEANTVAIESSKAMLTKALSIINT